MSTPHEIPENSSAQEPDFQAENSPFTGAEGTHPVSNNPGAPSQTAPSSQQDEAANSAPPDTLGGLVDPNLALLENGT